MGLEMDTGSVMMQLDTMNNHLSQVISRAEKTLFFITELEDTTDILQGVSYESIREYYATAHAKVMQGTILLTEALIQENNSYKASIAGCLSGIGYVDEDALKEDKRSIERQIRQVYSLIDASKGLYYGEWLNSLEMALALIEKKLDQIEDFMSATAGLYENITFYQENLRKGIECLHSAVFDGNVIRYRVNYVDSSWQGIIEKAWMERENNRNLTIKEPFVNHIVKEFGFDRGTGETLYKLYELMRVRGVENTNQKYFAMLASIAYPYSEDEKASLNYLWHYLAGTDSEQKIKNAMLSYGLEENEIESIFGCVSANHVSSCLDESELRRKLKKKKLSEEEIKRRIEQQKIYFGKTDMAHMAVTIATILKPDENDFEKAGDWCGLFNGVYDLDANAGYAGDVYGTAGNGPKLTPDDYKSDLDAVNISRNLEKEQNLILVINQYYSEMESGQTNRAEEFVTNIGNGNYRDGMSILVGQANQHADYMEEHGNLSLREITVEERKKVIDSFFRSLINNRNEYDEIDGLNRELAEQME